MSKYLKLFFGISLLFATTAIFANVSNVKLAKGVMVKMYKVAPTGHGASVGEVDLIDTPRGMMILPRLHGLTPGMHGFHVHDNPSCDDNGQAAGGHLDPQHTGKHLGPYNPNGHLGDLPVLTVDQDGKATRPLLAPRLTVSQVIGHSLMIHADGDNYSDSPKPLGGGGARIACGVVKR